MILNDFEYFDKEKLCLIRSGRSAQSHLSIETGFGFTADILNLIDSRNLRAYLRSMEHKFTPRETAYIIWRCSRLSQEAAFRLLEVLANTCDDPVLKTISALERAEQRLETNWKYCDDLTQEEDERLLALWDSFAASFPCPFSKGEFLHVIYGSGNFETQLVQLVDPNPDKFGCVLCEYTDAYGARTRMRFSIFLLERWTTCLNCTDED